jgi:hypothetical protein
MGTETVIMVANINGMTLFKKYHRLNIYVVQKDGTELRIKRKNIRHLPYTISVNLPVEQNPAAATTPEILFLLRGEILSVENRDEIFMDGTCLFQNMSFNRLFGTNTLIDPPPPNLLT